MVDLPMPRAQATGSRAPLRLHRVPHPGCSAARGSTAFLTAADSRAGDLHPRPADTLLATFFPPGSRSLRVLLTRTGPKNASTCKSPRQLIAKILSRGTAHLATRMPPAISFDWS